MCIVHYVVVCVVHCIVKVRGVFTCVIIYFICYDFTCFVMYSICYDFTGVVMYFICCDVLHKL